jgi:hypothetical protein
MSYRIMIADLATGAIKSPDSEFVARFKDANGFGGGDGTVTNVSVATANGISGTVATATTTPVITLDATTAIDAAIDTAMDEVAILIDDTIQDGGRWEPLTNGNVSAPEIIFSNGDVLMTFVED